MTAPRPVALGEPLPHQPGLDGLRTLAIFGVMASHAKLGVLRMGWVGVDVFFVLSGFLITTLLLRELDGAGRIHFRAFVLRRAARLLPALALALLVVGTWILIDPSALGLPARETLVGIPIAALYVGAWALAFDWHGLGAFSHTWSLSVEEHFYVVWPLFVAVVARLRGGRTRWFVGAYLAAIGYRLAVAAVTHGDFERLYFGPDTRAEQLLAGCALAAVLAERPSLGREWRWLPVAGIAAVGLLLGQASGVASTLHVWVGMSAAAVFSAVAVAAIYIHPRSLLARALSTAPMVWFGRRSYGMYLWYWPVTLWLRGSGIAVWPRFGIQVVATSLIAATSYRLLEQPVISWARRRASAARARDDVAGRRSSTRHAQSTA